MAFVVYFSKAQDQTNFLNISGVLFVVEVLFKIELNFLVLRHFKDSDFFENMILFLIKIAVTKDQVTTLTLRKKIKLMITTTLFLDQVIFYFLRSRR